MKLKRGIYLTIITFLILIPYNIYSETTKTNGIFDTKKREIYITSVSSKLDMKKSVFTFTGDVSVTGDASVMGDDMNMSCHKLEIFFKGALKDESKEKSKRSLEKIVATGSVVITRPDGGYARAEHAVYYHDLQQIVFTGNPDLDFMKDGTRYRSGGNGIIVTYDIKEECLLGEGTRDNKIKTNIKTEPGEDER